MRFREDVEYGKVRERVCGRGRGSGGAGSATSPLGVGICAL